MRATTLLLAFSLLSVQALGQDQLSRKDTAAILFSNRISFSSDGQPVLSIRIMEDQKSIQFSSKTGLLVHPSGPGGPSVSLPGSRRWKATLSNSKPAKLAWRIVLGRAKTGDFVALKSIRDSWQKRGFKTTRIEMGTLFSFQGAILDTRETLVCTEKIYASRAKALKDAGLLKQTYNADFPTQELLDARPEGQITVRSLDGEASFTANNALWFQPLGEGGLTVHEVEYARGFPWHGRQTRRYGGTFYVAADKQGRLAIANVLPAEKLLNGLVPAEIFPDSPMDALKAQAVTARGELLSKIGHRHLADPFVTCADQHCQVYKGLKAEKARVSKAVAKTRGQVMFNQQGELADARYSSTCGGHTEDGFEAWPGVTSPSLKGRWDNSANRDPHSRLTDDQVLHFLDHPPDSYCGRSPKAKRTFRWNKKIPAKKLNKMVNKKHKVGAVASIDVQHRGASGRANKILIQGDKGRATVHGELTIRRLFGSLKSSLFVLEKEMDSGGQVKSWLFRGGGFGHGVGMCQIGATEMAKERMSFKDILRFYYTNITIKRIY